MPDAPPSLSWLYEPDSPALTNIDKIPGIESHQVVHSDVDIIQYEPNRAVNDAQWAALIQGGLERNVKRTPDVHGVIQIPDPRTLQQPHQAVKSPSIAYEASAQRFVNYGPRENYVVLLQKTSSGESFGMKGVSGIAQSIPDPCVSEDIRHGTSRFVDIYYLSAPISIARPRRRFAPAEQEGPLDLLRVRVTVNEVNPGTLCGLNGPLDFSLQ